MCNIIAFVCIEWEQIAGCLAHRALCDEWASGVHHPQPQDLLKRIEVPVAMQKLVPIQQAEGRNPAVDGLANGVPSLAQQPWRGALLSEHVCETKISVKQTLSLIKQPNYQNQMPR